jgi:hypothetical protein
MHLVAHVGYQFYLLFAFPSPRGDIEVGIERN